MFLSRMLPIRQANYCRPQMHPPGSHLRILLEEMVLEIGNRIIQRRREDLEAGTVKAPKH